MVDESFKLHPLTKSLNDFLPSFAASNGNHDMVRMRGVFEPLDSPKDGDAANIICNDIVDETTNIITRVVHVNIVNKPRNLTTETTGPNDNQIFHCTPKVTTWDGPLALLVRGP
jgi:hypothetical protein